MTANNPLKRYSLYFILLPFYKYSALKRYLPAYGNILLQVRYVTLSIPFHTALQHIRYYNLNLISVNKLLVLEETKKPRMKPSDIITLVSEERTFHKTIPKCQLPVTVLLLHSNLLITSVPNLFSIKF